MVRSLVTRLDHLAAENTELKEQVLQQAETIRELRDEIAVLKGQKGRPVMKPSRMDKETNKDEQPGGRGRGKRRDSGQPAKTARLDIHEERTMVVIDVPDGSRFLGHRPFTVQDLRIGPHNTRFCANAGRPRTAGCSRRLARRNFADCISVRACVPSSCTNTTTATSRSRSGMSNCSNGAWTSPSAKSTRCWRRVRRPSRPRSPACSRRRHYGCVDFSVFKYS